jgi:hypothetical protein
MSNNASKTVYAAPGRFFGVATANGIASEGQKRKGEWKGKQL